MSENIYQEGDYIKIKPKVNLDSPETTGRVIPAEQKNVADVESVVDMDSSDPTPARNPRPEPILESKPESDTSKKPESTIPADAFDHEGDLFEQMKDKIMHTPLVAKMRIFFTQKVADHYDGRVTEIKGDMDRINIQKGAVTESKAEMEEFARGLERDGIPGADSLRKRIREMEAQELKIQKQYDQLDTRYKDGNNRHKMFISERNAIADRLIDKYDITLRPMEAQMAAIKSVREDFSVEESKVRERHADVKKQLDDAQAKLQELLTKNEKSPLSNSEKRKNAKTYIMAHQTRIGLLTERMSKEKKYINKKRLEIDSKIVQQEYLMGPYLDKRNEFIRLKGGSISQTEGVPPKIKVDAPPIIDKKDINKEYLYDDEGNEYASEDGEIKSVKKIRKDTVPPVPPPVERKEKTSDVDVAELKKFNFREGIFPEGYKSIENKRSVLAKVGFALNQVLTKSEFERNEELMKKAYTHGLLEKEIDEIVSLSLKIDKGMEDFIGKNNVVFLVSPEVLKSNRGADKSTVEKMKSALDTMLKGTDMEDDSPYSKFKNRILKDLKQNGVFNTDSTRKDLEKSGYNLSASDAKKMVKMVQEFLKESVQ